MFRSFYGCHSWREMTANQSMRKSSHMLEGLGGGVKLVYTYRSQNVSNFSNVLFLSHMLNSISRPCFIFSWHAYKPININLPSVDFTVISVLVEGAPEVQWTGEQENNIIINVT